MQRVVQRFTALHRIANLLGGLSETWVRRMRRREGQGPIERHTSTEHRGQSSRPDSESCSLRRAPATTNCNLVRCDSQLDRHQQAFLERRNCSALGGRGEHAVHEPAIGRRRAIVIAVRRVCHVSYRRAFRRRAQLRQPKSHRSRRAPSRIRRAKSFPRHTPRRVRHRAVGARRSSAASDR